MRYLENSQFIAAANLLRLFFLQFVSLLAAGQLVAQTDVSEGLVITDINVVDVANGQISANKTVSIADGRIISIDDAGATNSSDRALTLDGSGLYLMPGLIDAHVHIEANDLPIYIANGITSVIEMNGSPEKLAIRSGVREGALVGPRIYMTSPLLAGNAQDFSFRLIENPGQARTAVRESKELGYDFIKVYDGLSLASYTALVASAEEFNMPLLGHIPASVTIQTVLRDQFKSIEHVEQITRSALGHSFEQDQIPAIVGLFRDANSAVTPTLAAMEILSARRTSWFDSLYEREEMRFTPDSVEPWWLSMRAPLSARNSLTASSPGGSGAAIEFYRQLTRQLHDAGVLLLAGTDTPNPLLVPGYALHHELAALSRSGISNADILRMATMNVAAHLHAESSFGRIEEGLLAELVLLRGDPLANLEALKAIEGVVLGDNYFSYVDIEELLKR